MRTYLIRYISGLTLSECFDVQHAHSLEKALTAHKFFFAHSRKVIAKLLD